MKLISTTTLTTTTTTVTFASIPQDATDLVLFTSLRDSAAVVNTVGARIIFNGVGTGYTRRNLVGNGSGAVSESETTGWIRFGQHPGANATANTFSNDFIYIPNYAGSTNKSVSTDAVGENNATQAFQVLTAGLWSNTAAITQVEIQSNQTSFVAGSTFSLYKITKGSDGIVTTS
jgi:hypothetical protein